MKAPSPDNSYALLALFLSPWKDAETLEALTGVGSQAQVRWESLLHMANLHLCTALWYAHLRKDGLLPLLPPEMQTYLAHLHEANAERNATYRHTTGEILSELQDMGVPVILLKGAATFCDNLYDDPGARMMVDIDLLVKPSDAEPVRQRLLHLGYRELPDPFDDPGQLGAYPPHHLPPLQKPDTPVVVEIHFQAARGQAGRILTNDLSWENAKEEASEGFSGVVLAPSCRLLHNTVHALVPFAQSVASNISLAQMAEFTHLAQRYRQSINWSLWLQRGTSQGMGRLFRIYLSLAHGLMAMPLPREVPGVHLAPMHVARVSVAANYKACLYGRQGPPERAAQRLKWLITAIYIFLYARLTKPVWVWHNLCYKKGVRHIPTRILYLLAFFTRRKPKELLDKGDRYSIVRKVACLLRGPDRL